MSDLRAGGIALVLTSKDPKYIGCCIDLIKLVYPGPFDLDGSSFFWKSDNGPCWIGNYLGEYVAFMPRQLMPIDGHDFTEEEREKEEEL